jgi:hypothetical protein
MGRSPGAFQAMLGSTGQGAKDAAALAGRSEFGSDKAFNALGKMVTEARGDTRILVPSATTAGAAIAKRKMNETMLQKIIAGGKPIFSGDNIVGVDEDGTYTGRASASPYGTKPTIEQQTRDEPVESEPEAPIPDKPSTKMSSAAKRKRVSALGAGAGSARQRKFF